MTALRQGRFRVEHRVLCNTLIIDLRRLHRVLSSAPRGGGVVRARSILNHQVPPHPAFPHKIAAVRLPEAMKKWSDPARYLGKLAGRLKAASPIVGLMTAVPMTQLVRDREESEGLWIECFCTVGVSNAVKAGEPASHGGKSRCCEQAGTINIILVTNATLAWPAMVGAVQVATESKTATLIEHGVRSASGLLNATGTGTDAVVIACRVAGGHKVQYSGTHTETGSMIGRLVARCVREGLLRSARWQQSCRTSDRPET